MQLNGDAAPLLSTLKYLTDAAKYLFTKLHAPLHQCLMGKQDQIQEDCGCAVSEIQIGRKYTILLISKSGNLRKFTMGTLDKMKSLETNPSS